tara:strand:- start:2321 stop:2557 length:237 start_codon:yes stop_codon:yes gene_type:complete
LDHNTFDIELDCRGLNCPLPILKTKKTMDGMVTGQVLKMLSTDPGSKNDLTAWAGKTDNEILILKNDGKDFVFYIRKG